VEIRLRTHWFSSTGLAGFRTDKEHGRRNSDLFQGHVTPLSSKNRQIEDAKIAASQRHETLEKRATIFGAPQTLDILRF
jgi:hypothetical protein